MTIADAARLAVLIDSDNTTASLATELLEEIAKYGTPTIKRAYGDWTTQQLTGWKEELLRHAIQPVQQFAYTRGKNSTDSALIIDAMDLLYARNLEGFVIVSSDSDFTRLATRLRESGMTVYGLGRRNTPAPFVAACDRFDGDRQHVQGRRLVPSRRGRVLPGQEPRSVRSARLRPREARRAGPQAALRRDEERDEFDWARPAVGAAEANASGLGQGRGRLGEDLPLSTAAARVPTGLGVLEDDGERTTPRVRAEGQPFASTKVA